MAENSKIEWCHATFNPWVGCEKVSPACDHCYAEGWAKRTGQPQLWSGERRRTTDAYWRGPIKWNAAAATAGERRRVFCASLADVFDDKADFIWRRDLWHLISDTPSLDWLLLTKRPQNIRDMLPGRYGILNPWPWSNVWLGTTAENPEECVRRVPHLRSVPAVVRFLSIEPMLRPLAPDLDGIDWVICGGESGPNARLMDPTWARSLMTQCGEESVAFFMKQMTRKAPIAPDLMVRQFPKPRR